MNNLSKKFPDLVVEEVGKWNLRKESALWIWLHYNVLMHREFTNSYTAKFVIEAERIYAENANRAASDGFITEANLEPVPKNPIIVPLDEKYSFDFGQNSQANQSNQSDQYQTKCNYQKMKFYY